MSVLCHIPVKYISLILLYGGKEEYFDTIIFDKQDEVTYGNLIIRSGYMYKSLGIMIFLK